MKKLKIYKFNFYLVQLFLAAVATLVILFLDISNIKEFSVVSFTVASLLIVQSVISIVQLNNKIYKYLIGFTLIVNLTAVVLLLPKDFTLLPYINNAFEFNYAIAGLVILNSFINVLVAFYFYESYELKLISLALICLIIFITAVDLRIPYENYEDLASRMSLMLILTSIYSVLYYRYFKSELEENKQVQKIK